MREAARRIGIPESTYREWEYGSQIRGEPYAKIATAFGVTLDDLLGDPVRQINDSIERDFDKLFSDLRSLRRRVLKEKD